MPVYNFKRIGPVPEAMELVDIVLMRTQRKTPTVVHPGYKISRIRAFYIRKIKFTQETITERLSAILTDFPRLNDIHPFYADLCNTLYDRDHYKLALGRLNAARGLVESISRDMIRMVKYGDSLYRCKCLKRAALGRMCTILKRQKAPLSYLEEVRKHLSRLPALDPNTRTLLLCGLPNVGKSSFMNKITRGNVEVQPYAFTTKSLFVGHTDYKYLRWQVIDTPGILDHSLEERNTIEMQSVIALAHLQCSVLYFVDISEQCGYPLEQQCSLFEGIKPLFANKQLIVVVNKVDQQPWESLEAEKREMVQALVDSAGAAQNCTLLTMSNISEHGVSEVKKTACEKLLQSRVDARVAGNKVEAVVNRLQVFQPAKRDTVVRDVCIPQSVLMKQEQEQQQTQDLEDDEAEQLFRDKKSKRTSSSSRVGYAPTIHDNGDGDVNMSDNNGPRKTARDRMWENGGPGVWSMDDRELYDLKNEDWKFDAIPEIMDGKNIADYMDAEIERKLAELEEEEEQLMNEYQAAQMENEAESDLDSEEEAAVHAIRDRKKTIRLMKHMNHTENKSMAPREIRGRAKDKYDAGARDAKEIQRKMSQYGVDVTEMLERGRSRSRQERGRKRERSLSRGVVDKDNDNDMMDQDMSKGQQKRVQRAKSEERQREQSITRGHNKRLKTWTPQSVGLNTDKVSLAKKLERKGRKGWTGASGEGDNRKSEHLIQWMNTGKKRNGTHYCR